MALLATVEHSVDQDKIREIDLVVPALRYLAKAHSGLDITELKARLIALFRPNGINMMPIESDVPPFEQIVRNIVSNRRHGKNMIHQGFASYDEDSHVISITAKGLTLLNDIGYRT
jgi:hypothetical protein